MQGIYKYYFDGSYKKFVHQVYPEAVEHVDYLGEKLEYLPYMKYQD